LAFVACSRVNFYRILSKFIGHSHPCYKDTNQLLSTFTILHHRRV